MLFEFLEILGGGLTYRIRGGLGNTFIQKLFNKPGGWEIPNTIIRAIWAAYLTFIVFLKLELSYLLIPVAILAFVGVVFGYFGAEFDLSRSENRNIKNLALLTVRGAGICAPLMLCVPFIAYPGVIAGTFFTLYYLLGNTIYKFCKLQGPSQWGEWLLGSFIIGFIQLY